MSTTSGFPLRLSTFEGTDYLFSFVIIAMKGIYDFLRLTVIFIWSAGIVVEDSTCFEEDIPRHEIAASDTNRLYQRPESRKRILMVYYQILKFEKLPYIFIWWVFDCHFEGRISL